MIDTRAKIQLASLLKDLNVRGAHKLYVHLYMNNMVEALKDLYSTSSYPEFLYVSNPVFDMLKGDK